MMGTLGQVRLRLFSVIGIPVEHQYGRIIFAGVINRRIFFKEPIFFCWQVIQVGNIKIKQTLMNSGLIGHARNDLFDEPSIVGSLRIADNQNFPAFFTLNQVTYKLAISKMETDADED